MTLVRQSRVGLIGEIGERDAEVVRIGVHAARLERRVAELRAPSRPGPRPVLRRIRLPAREVALADRATRDVGESLVVEGIDDADLRLLEDRIPAPEEDASPGPVDADGAVAGREDRVVLVGREAGLELEPRAPFAAESLRAAHTQHRGLVGHSLDTVARGIGLHALDERMDAAVERERVGNIGAGASSTQRGAERGDTGPQGACFPDDCSSPGVRASFRRSAGGTPKPYPRQIPKASSTSPRR